MSSDVVLGGTLLAVYNIKHSHPLKEVSCTSDDVYDDLRSVQEGRADSWHRLY
jgi:hypothetical protein